MIRATANADLEEREGFRFRGGHRALDLAATLQGRLKPASRELLAVPDDLTRWLVAARLAPSRPGVTLGDLDDARQLREAIYTYAGARLSNGPDVADARDTINRFADAGAAVPRLTPNGTVEMVGSAKSLIAALAQEAIELLGGDQADRIRQCEAATCTIFFVDASRSGDRRWCSMSGCGNKAKVAEFRRRKRNSSDGA